MKKTFVSTVIALTLALILMATPALAQTQRTALGGTEHMFFGVAGRVWVTNGLIQQRGVPLTGTFDFGAMKGTETQLANATLNPATGEGHVWGVVTYTDSATGITCSGLREGKIANFLITAKIVAPCSDGSLLQGTLRDVNIIVPLGSPVPTEVYSYFDGELLSP